jgi:hypothetical protein
LIVSHFDGCFDVLIVSHFDECFECHKKYGDNRKIRES